MRWEYPGVEDSEGPAVRSTECTTPGAPGNVGYTERHGVVVDVGYTQWYSRLMSMYCSHMDMTVGDMLDTKSPTLHVPM